MKTIPRILLIVGALGLIAGLILYFIGTVTIEVKGDPVKLDKATYWTKRSSGFFSPSTHYFSQIQVEPTATTVPNMKYVLALDNGIFQQNYEVSWSQLEIAIHKSKTIDNRISQDEYTALGMQASYTTKIFEVRPQRQVLYLLPGIAILVAFVISLIAQKTTRPPIPESKRPSLPIISPELKGHYFNERAESSRSNEGGTFTSNQASPNDTPPPNASEPIEFLDPNEFVRPWSVFKEGQYLLSNFNKSKETANQNGTQKADPWKDTAASHMKRQVDDLVKEGKLNPTEGIKYRQEIDDTKNDPHFLDDTMHRLWAIRQRHRK